MLASSSKVFFSSLMFQDNQKHIVKQSHAMLTVLIDANSLTLQTEATEPVYDAQIDIKLNDTHKTPLNFCEKRLKKMLLQAKQLFLCFVCISDGHSSII